MATRLDREKLQRVNEKHKNVLAVILSREENKYCADCLAKGPRWASWNLGVLLCIRCSGLHRSLGVHISRVKSVNLDTWSKEQMVNFCCRGNGWAKDTYEARLPKDFKRPTTDSGLEYFIRDKYEKKKYICQAEVKLRSISDLGLFEEDATKNKRKEQRSRENVSVPSIAKPKGLHPNLPSIPRPKSLPQLPKHQEDNPVQQTPNQHKSPATDDLLGLTSPLSANVPTSVSVAAAPAPPSADLTDDLFGPLSSHIPHNITSSVSSPDLVNGQSNTPPDPSATEQSAQDKKMSKDSILSLYAQGTKAPSPNPMMPEFGALAYQQPTAMPYGQQSYQNAQAMPMQGLPGAYMNQQQQMMAMQQQQQQQQQQLQMQQMSQQMAGMNMGGMGYQMMAGQQQQQQNPMPNNMQYGMGYGVQPQQVSHPGYSPQQQQQMYGNVANGTGAMGQMPAGMMQMGGYGGVPNAMMAAGGPGAMGGMPGQQGVPWGPAAVPQAAAGMNTGHTLSTQLWK